MHWLSPGDNAWQMTAATLVGLMSVPGLVVLYGGVMQKRWSVNSMMMAFVAFALVLLVWVGYGFKMAFGSPLELFGSSGGDFFANFIGNPGPILDSSSLLNQGTIPLLGDVGKLAFPQSTLAYFQFVFAAITPILMLGLGARPDQLQGLDPVRDPLVEPHLHGQRVPDLGRRLLRAAGSPRLLRRLRDPSRGRGLGVRRSSGDRAAPPARPRGRRSEQSGDGRGRSGPALDGLERVQRRRPLPRQRGRIRGDSEHQPVHRGRLPGLGRLGLRHRPQAEPHLERQRHDHGPRGNHTSRRLRQRLGRDRDRPDRRRPSSTSRSTT